MQYVLVKAVLFSRINLSALQIRVLWLMVQILIKKKKKKDIPVHVF